MTKIISNITIVMNDGARSPEPCKFTVTDSGLIERVDLSVEIELAQIMLRKAIRDRNSVLGTSFAAVKVAHEEVMLLRSVVADLESGA